MPSFFPNVEAENLVICVTGRGATKEFCALMSNLLPDLETISKSQCFPRYIYSSTEGGTGRKLTMKPPQTLFDEGQGVADKAQFTRTDAISDDGLSYFICAYPGEKIIRDDVFFYVYGLLHSAAYISRFADNLAKQLPHIPAVKKFSDFRAFSIAGRALADQHVGYETVQPYPVTLVLSKPLKELAPADYRVTQMRFEKGTDGERHDKSTVVYNHNITIRNIPLEAYEYIVNGKPAVEWVIERQATTTHGDSGIVNDANDWATETMNNPAYPLELFQRVITVSLETMKIVKALPPLDI